MVSSVVHLKSLPGFCSCQTGPPIRLSFPADCRPAAIERLANRNQQFGVRWVIVHRYRPFSIVVTHRKQQWPSFDCGQLKTRVVGLIRNRQPPFAVRAGIGLVDKDPFATVFNLRSDRLSGLTLANWALHGSIPL